MSLPVFSQVFSTQRLVHPSYDEGSNVLGVGTAPPDEGTQAKIVALLPDLFAAMEGGIDPFIAPHAVGERAPFIFVANLYTLFEIDTTAQPLDRLVAKVHECWRFHSAPRGYHLSYVDHCALFPSDFTLQVGGEDIPCHRAIVQRYSHFSSQTVASIPKAEVLVLLEWMYSGFLPDHLADGTQPNEFRATQALMRHTIPLRFSILWSLCWHRFQELKKGVPTSWPMRLRRSLPQELTTSTQLDVTLKWGDEEMCKIDSHLLRSRSLFFFNKLIGHEVNAEDWGMDKLMMVAWLDACTSFDYPSASFYDGGDCDSDARTYKPQSLLSSMSSSLILPPEKFRDYFYSGVSEPALISTISFAQQDGVYALENYCSARVVESDLDHVALRLYCLSPGVSFTAFQHMVGARGSAHVSGLTLLEDGEYIEEEEIEAVLPWVALNVRYLRHLEVELDSIPISGEVAGVIRQNPSLETFSFNDKDTEFEPDFDPITAQPADGANELLSALAGLSRLRKLHVDASYDKFSLDLDQLSRLVQSNPLLHTVTLHPMHTIPASSDVVNVFAACANLRTLKIVRSLSLPTGDALTRFVASCTHLEHLHAMLDSTVTDRDLVVLRQLKGLRSLGFTSEFSVPITGEGLLNLVSELPNLIRFDTMITMREVSRSFPNELARRQPHLRVSTLQQLLNPLSVA